MGQQRHFQERRGLTAAGDSPAVRRQAAALAGHHGEADTARRLLADPDASVRATALGALGRMGQATESEIGAATKDPAPTVRQRACEVAVSTSLGGDAVVILLSDRVDAVVEVAAWAAGELERVDAVPTLSEIATGHRDPLAREAAVAALGALGDPRGLAAILAATTDKPAIRRRAVLALAPFEGPEVSAAIQRAKSDRDWQVRDTAQLLEP